MTDLEEMLIAQKRARMIPTSFNCVLHYRERPRPQPSASFHKDSDHRREQRRRKYQLFFSRFIFYSYQRNRIHTTKSPIKYSSLHSSDSNNSKPKLYVWFVEDQFCKIHHSISCYTKDLLVTGGGYFQFLPNLQTHMLLAFALDL